MGLIDDEGIGLARKLGGEGLFLFQVAEVFEKQHPGGLLRVIEPGGAACLLAEDVIDIDILANLPKHPDGKPPGIGNRKSMLLYPLTALNKWRISGPNPSLGRFHKKIGAAPCLAPRLSAVIEARESCGICPRESACDWLTKT
jgi:hypothetical protein